MFALDRAGLLGRRRHVNAVRGVNLEVREGESVGLVGETGSGKSTIAKLILGLETPTAGAVVFDGHDLATVSREEHRRYRHSVQAVFQDPTSSLNPRMRISSIVVEAATAAETDREALVDKLLNDVGLRSDVARRFPHELSGGMRQRVAIARALACMPRMIVLDEPVSSLDVSVRAQVTNVLKDLHSRSRIAYLMIAHDLATVRYLCQRIVVLHLGEIVEEADTESLFSHPRHPYTQALLSATLPTRPGVEREEIVLSGEVPSPVNPPAGCKFHVRCPFAQKRCTVEEPLLRPFSRGHDVACHYAEDIAARKTPGSLEESSGEVATPGRA